ncbi:Stc1 domain-containing protein [Tricladium varicosporioides]|nr:Stc1 domain-containing protein [Hymenoscyphus varicosporioides]
MSYSYNSYTAAQRERVVLPGRFRCFLCNKYKDVQLFSKKELDKARNKALHSPVTSENAKIRCLVCNDNQVHEIKCRGHCGLTKPLSAFSKNARRNKHYWCTDCVLWKESLEHGVPVPPAPNNPAAPDELPISSSGHGTPSEASVYGDGGDTESRVSAWYSTPATATNNRSGPPSLADCLQFMSISGSTNPKSAGQPEYIPPHIRAGANNCSGPRPTGMARNAQSFSSISNPYEDAQIQDTKTGKTMIEDYGDDWEDGTQRGPLTPFNAWDLNGNRHVRARQPFATTPGRQLASANIGPASSGRYSPTTMNNNRTFTKLPSVRFPNKQMPKTCAPTVPQSLVTQPQQQEAKYGCEGDSDGDDWD